MKDYMARHHMVPSSRGGSDEDWNIKDVRRSLHSAWHLLFGNLTPNEVLMLVQSGVKLETPARKNAWTTLFGKMSNGEVLYHIIEEWSPRGKP